MHTEAGAENDFENISEIARPIKISLAGHPSSCIINIGKQKYRALIDTGAEVSLMSKRIYDLLKDRPKLQRKTVSIHAVNSGPLSVDGCIKLPIDIGGYQMCQEFYIVKDINRNLILGQDFLEQNGVRIYLDLGCISPLF